MAFFRSLVLRHRARKVSIQLLRFAERLRKRDSEFAPTYKDTLETLGDELAVLARDHCRNHAERLALVKGLTAALQHMYRNDMALTSRVAGRLAPRVLAGMPQIEGEHRSMSAAVH
jgi:hypothetical protein